MPGARSVGEVSGQLSRSLRRPLISLKSNILRTLRDDIKDPLSFARRFKKPALSRDRWKIHHGYLMTVFALPPESPPPEEPVYAALRSLGLPTRSPVPALNRIGRRLEALLRPNGRGRVPRETVRRYLEAATVRIAKLGKPWKRVSDEEILAEIGVRKIIIAAGKSSRFSPSLARKQLARGDGLSSLLLQARQAVGLHCCPDVVVVDPVTAHHFISQMGLAKKISASKLRSSFRKLERPQELDSLMRELEDFDPWADSPRELAEICRQTRTLLKDRFPHEPARVALVLEEFSDALFRPFIESLDGPIGTNSEAIRSLGRDAILALVRPWGTGEAFIEALQRIKTLGLASRTRYVMPIYSDYAPALLPDYPPIYLLAYMEAVASPDAVITIGAKSPLDKVEDRGHIVFADGRDGLEAQAIREWRDLTPDEQKDARRRLELSKQTGQPHHGLNAGVFVIDRAWAERQAPRLRRDFDHPDEAKGKLHEYWYTDLVELAAQQRKPRKVVFLGPDAPAGCKDVPRVCRFNKEMMDSIRSLLLDLGVNLDVTARVRLTGADPTFSPEAAAREIFGKRPDSIYLYGDVFLEDTVKIADGVVLDGRGRPVELRDNTSVGKGVGIRSSTAADTCFADNPLDEFSYQPPEAESLNTPTEVVDSDLLASYIGPEVDVVRSMVMDSFVQGDVFESTLLYALVTPDEAIEGLRSQDSVEELLCRPVGSKALKHLTTNQEHGEVHLDPFPHAIIPGAFLIGELSPRDRKGVLRFVLEETQKLFSEKITDEEERDRALAETRRLWECDALLDAQTPEQLYRQTFGWLRYTHEDPDCSDPFCEEKRAELDALRPLANEQFERLLAHDFADDSATRSLFRELTLLATQANLFDWQSPTVRSLLGKQTARKRKRSGSSQNPQFEICNLQFEIPPSPALDGYPTYESFIFDATPADFLYLTDNTGEALFDVLVWYSLCELGHRVTVAAKAKPAGGDATVDDVLQLIEERPALRAHFDRRNLRVISNGSDTYGTLLDRVPEEFRVTYHSPTLRAIIGKGQANLYTTVARNRLKVPFIAQFLVKGMTAERLSGVRTLRRKGQKIPRPVIAVIPPGRCITDHAPGTAGSGTLRGLLGVRPNT